MSTVHLLIEQGAGITHAAYTNPETAKLHAQIKRKEFDMDCFEVQPVELIEDCKEDALKELYEIFEITVKQDVRSDNGNLKLLRDLDIQDSINGESEGTKILRAFLSLGLSQSQWEAMTNVSHHRYGKSSYEDDIFYYPNKALLGLINIGKKIA